MPFAYAGTRRRRNRDRRRKHETPENSVASQDRTDPEAREERDPMATRQTTGTDAITTDDGPDMHDPDSRDPDAPPVDNRS